MTAPNAQAPVNVLWVMLDLIDLALNSGGRRGEDEIDNEPAIALFESAVAARTAMAELIEANRKIVAIYGPLSASMRIGSERRDAWNELFAAIARV